MFFLVPYWGHGSAYKNKTVSFFGPKGLLNDGDSRLNYANICIFIGTNIGIDTEIEVIMWIMK